MTKLRVGILVFPKVQQLDGRGHPTMPPRFAMRR